MAAKAEQRSLRRQPWPSGVNSFEPFDQRSKFDQKRTLIQIKLNYYRSDATTEQFRMVTTRLPSCAYARMRKRITNPLSRSANQQVASFMRKYV